MFPSNGITIIKATDDVKAVIRAKKYLIGIQKAISRFFIGL